jgi:hypothetical protein
MQHEALKQKIPEIHFKPEGYVHLDDNDFLEQFTTELTKEGLDPGKLVFRGADATNIFESDGSFKRPPGIFAMDEPTWKREAEKSFGETTPAGYTKFAETPCILLYDLQQLAEAYDYKLELDPEDPSRIVRIYDIKPGDALTDLPAGKSIEEVVIHKDYPENPVASPTDALAGIVYLDLD